MKWFLAAITMLMLAGCGDGAWQWFPESGTTSGAPNAFNFTPNSLSIGATTSSSNVVSITGNNPSGWTVSISTTSTPAGATSSMLINGTAAPGASATILPNQTLQILQTFPITQTGTVVTSVQAGTFNTSFTTTITP